MKKWAMPLSEPLDDSPAKKWNGEEFDVTGGRGGISTIILKYIHFSVVFYVQTPSFF